MRRFFLFSLILFTLFCSSCKDEQPVKKDNDFQTQTLMKISANVDNLSGVLSFNKSVLKKMDPVEFSLSLKDSSGKPFKGALITLDLVMPGMEMPENKVKMQENANSEYRGTGMFTMKGDWRAVTIIEVNGNRKELNFDFVVE